MPRTTNLNNKPPLGTLIAKRLITIRKTQKWLAQDAGLGKQYVFEIISGISEPSLKTLRKIAKSLDIDVKKLAITLLSDD